MKAIALIRIWLIGIALDLKMGFFGGRFTATGRTSEVGSILLADVLCHNWLQLYRYKSKSTRT